MAGIAHMTQITIRLNKFCSQKLVFGDRIGDDLSMDGFGVEKAMWVFLQKPQESGNNER